MPVRTVTTEPREHERAGVPADSPQGGLSLACALVAGRRSCSSMRPSSLSPQPFLREGGPQPGAAEVEPRAAYPCAGARDRGEGHLR